MAISVGRTIKQLTDMAKELKVYDDVKPTGKNGRIMKEDLIYPIRQHNLIERYGSLDKIPKHLSWVLSMKSPMLAKRVDGLKEEQQKEVWDDSNWWFEQKLNGVRCFIVNDGNGLQIYSRHNSDTDLLPISFTSKIKFPKDFDYSLLKKKFILDCEMESDNPQICTILENSGVVTATQLQAVTSLLSSTDQRAHLIQDKNDLLLAFNVFDCVLYDDQWVMNEPLYRRRELVNELIQVLKNAGFNARGVRTTNVDKKQFYEGLVSQGLEGCVAKRIDGIYIPDTTRNFNGWIKLKRSISEAYQSEYADMSVDFSSMFGDTIDAFITGFEPGRKGSEFEKLIGSVSLSVYVRKSDGSLEEREIAKVSGFNLDLRKDMTHIVNGEVTLNPSYMHRVMEIDGQQITKNLRFAHATFQQFRYDKLRDSCILDEDFLVSLIV